MQQHYTIKFQNKCKRPKTIAMLSLSFRSIFLTKLWLWQSPWWWCHKLENAPLVTFLCHSAPRVNLQHFICCTITREKLFCRVECAVMLSSVNYQNFETVFSKFPVLRELPFFHHHSNCIYPIVQGTFRFCHDVPIEAYDLE